MKKIYLQLPFYFLFLFVIAGQLHGQNSRGAINGIIVDGQTGESLPGASIYIDSLAVGTTTDLEGRFELRNVPVGLHQLEASYVGYQNQVQSIEVTEGETKEVEYKLGVFAIEGVTVVITAQAFGQRAAINQQLASSSVVNIVSAEKIKELPDANAAEAIGRLPGVSLKRSSGEASQVVIRGLSPKYNVVTLEGIKMSSTSDFDRSVDLSLIQSELLAGIEVTKSLRPDLDADALGGTVNLRLARAPEDRKLSFIAEGGYSGLTKDFNNYRVAGGISQRFFKKKLGASFKASYEQKQLPSHRFNAGYSGASWSFVKDDSGNLVDSSLIVRTQSTTLVEQLMTRKRTNASVILDYENDWLDMKFFNLISQKNDDITNRSNQYLFTTGGNPQNFALDLSDTDWKTGSRTHSLQNEIKLSQNSTLQVSLSTTFANQTQDEQNFPFIELGTFGLNENNLIYGQPSDIISQIGGPEALNVGNTFLRSFNLNSRSLTDESYDARIDYTFEFKLAQKISGKLKVGGKYHTLTRTSDGTSKFSSFEFGGGVGRRQTLLSKFPWIETDINAQRGINASNFVDPNYQSENFLNGRYELGWSGDIDLLTDMQGQFFTGQDNDPNYFINGVESYIRDYQASENLVAGYIQTEINFGKNLMILPGVRVEENQTEYSAFHIKTNSGQSGIEPNPKYITTNRKNLLWFPSVNLKYKPTNVLTIQAAVYRSTTRPSFRQISPLVIYPATNNFIRSNNPFLKPATALNYDLGFSLNKKKLGFITVYGFYKEIDDLIFVMGGYFPNKKGSIVNGPEDLDDRILGAEYYDEFFLDNNGRTDLPFNNPEKAYVSGIEFSWQTNFWYLRGLLKGLVLDVNYSIINSRTKYPFFNSVQVGVDSSGFIPQPIFGQRYNSREGQLEDQPSSILNIIIGWDYKGFSSRLSYRYQSRTIEGLDARYSIFDRVYDTFTLLDFTLNQKITKSVSLYANFKNLGLHVDDYFFDEQPGRASLPTSSQAYGFRSQFGLRVNL